MSKLGLGNVIGGVGTSVLTLFTISLCAAGVASQSRGLVTLGGLLVLLTLFLNMIGGVVGIVSVVQNPKDWKNWAGIGLHVANLGFWFLLFLLGALAKHHQQTHWVQ